MLQARWTAASQRWIDTIDERLPSQLMTAASEVLETEAVEALVSARRSAPVFEGDLRDDLDIYRRRFQRWRVSITLGESGALAITGEDTVSVSPPFSYPLAKEKGVPRPHRVWLYASSSRSREKLRRYVRQLYPALPDDQATHDALRAQGVDLPPPHIDVEVAARHFLYPQGDVFIRRTISGLRKRLGPIWRGR